ncbi:soxA [Scenedesmus sp. PABB004]|nr:soxA [Scenedesmus sp. PABB004]
MLRRAPQIGAALAPLLGPLGAARALAASAAPPPKRYDVIVAGLGAHGSACLFHLARWGSRVLGLERFNSLSNARASHHGESRITRMAYMEGPAYVPLLRKAFECVSALERETQQTLYHQTGCLNIGDPIAAAARATAVDQQLPHEMLTGAQAQRRWPGLQLRPDTSVLFEETAGILEPEKMIQAHLLRAWYHGAHVKTGEAVLAWEPLPDGGVAVATESGTYHADRLVLAGGAWMAQLVPELEGLCVPGRATVGWFAPTTAPGSYAGLPVYLLQADGVAEPFYGFPEFGKTPGVKIGKFCVSAACDPDALDREQRPDDVAPLRAALAAHLPGAAGALLGFAACMFTMTPDGHFIIDAHPRHPQVLIASACSGHGFKLSPAVGLILADMARNGGAAAEFSDALQLFRLRRDRPGHAAALDRFAAAA